MYIFLNIILISWCLNKLAYNSVSKTQQQDYINVWGKFWIIIQIWLRGQHQNYVQTFWGGCQVLTLGKYVWDITAVEGGIKAWWITKMIEETLLKGTVVQWRATILKTVSCFFLKHNHQKSKKSILQFFILIHWPPPLKLRWSIHGQENHHSYKYFYKTISSFDICLMFLLFNTFCCFCLFPRFFYRYGQPHDLDPANEI